MVTCRMVVAVGTRYCAVWTASLDGSHYHRHEEPITKEAMDQHQFPTVHEAVCDTCHTTFTDLHPGLSAPTLWDTEDGKLHPGDMWEARHYHEEGHCPFWDDCPGYHLVVRLPNMVDFDMDARASNCAKPQDKRHRCWSRSGTPPKISLGPGCGANYSIQVGNWHGHLQNGELFPG